MKEKLNVDIEIEKGVLENIMVSFQKSLVFLFFKVEWRDLTTWKVT